jgi:hypothetical protein
VAYRWFPDLIPRARQRLTVQVRPHPRVMVGVEVNPLADEVGPLVNLHLLTETGTRPALLAGTSSDRIGTPDGRAYYATLSKDLSPWLRWPVAPYAGASYGTFDNRLRAIGGVWVSLGERWSALVIHDGVHVTLSVDVEIGGHLALSGLLFDGDEPGVSMSVAW